MTRYIQQLLLVLPVSEIDRSQILWLKSESSRGAIEKSITKQKKQTSGDQKPVFRCESAANEDEKGGKASKTSNANDAVALGIGNMHPDVISNLPPL